MSKASERQTEDLKKELKPGETVVAVGKFSAVPGMCLFFGIAICSFVAGRIFTSQIVILMLTNLLCMWMMIDAARTLTSVQSSCVLVTDRRVYGLAAGKRFSLNHRKFKGTPIRFGMFLDAGDARSSVVLRHMTNHREVFAALDRYQ